MKTVIEMARSVGAAAYTNRHYPDRPTHTFNVDQLQAFAELVRADERDKWMERTAILIRGERKACAELTEKLTWADNKGVASAIRARGSNT